MSYQICHHGVEFETVETPRYMVRSEEEFTGWLTLKTIDGSSLQILPNKYVYTQILNNGRVTFENVCACKMSRSMFPTSGMYNEEAGRGHFFWSFGKE